MATNVLMARAVYVYEAVCRPGLFIDGDTDSLSLPTPGQLLIGGPTHVARA
jgi:hypothetical protein